MHNDRGLREGNKIRVVFITSPEIRKKQFAEEATPKESNIVLNNL